MSQAVRAKVAVDALGSTEWRTVYDHIHSLGVERTFPFEFTVADGITDQSPIVIGATGIVTVEALVVTTDTDISVTLGAAGSNAAFQLNANGILVLIDTSLTDMSFSNSSGATATVFGLLGGAS